MYDQRGKRYLDLYQDGGRGILGHRPSGLSNALKDALGKGGLAPYPSILERRLSKHLSDLLPGFSVFRLYASFERLMGALASVKKGVAGEKEKTIEKTTEWTHSGGCDLPRPRLIDPALPSGTPKTEAMQSGVPHGARDSVLLWRPFLPAGPNSGIEPEIVVPVVPFPGSMAPWAAAFREAAVEFAPPSDSISPTALAAMSRAVCDMISSMKSTAPDMWEGLDLPGWCRRGPYLSAECTREEYPRRFRRYLAAGVLLNPGFPGPSILPLEWSEGERMLVAKLAQEDANADT